jgi:hypothetical protein
METNYHTTTRIPIDDQYAATLGKAVYAFAYYEWTIIYIIEKLEAGFVAEYSRPKKQGLTSGAVKKKLKEVITKTAFPFKNVTEPEMLACMDRFEELIEERNALIHAHPITAKDGSQILNYQTSPSKKISDMAWPAAEIERLIQEIDMAAIRAGSLLDKMR